MGGTGFTSACLCSIVSVCLEVQFLGFFSLHLMLCVISVCLSVCVCVLVFVCDLGRHKEEYGRFTYIS